MNPDALSKVRAIESLRAGVPNSDVVKVIPPVQADVEAAFDRLLLFPDGAQQANAHGMVLEGEFGGGKSHWLEYFQDRAMHAGFVCSAITLNKETPLYDLAKIYRASVLSSAAKDRTGAAIFDIVFDYDAQKEPGFAAFFDWAHAAAETGALDPRLAASLRLFSKTSDEEVRFDLLTEWMGFPMKVGVFRSHLAGIGDTESVRIARTIKAGYLERFEFLSRLLISRGFNGWLLLVDETETISKYTLRQRAKAYANLARLLGSPQSNAPQGIATVATITKDFAATVLRGSRKNDLQNIPSKLRGSRDEPYLLDAESGMRRIDSGRIELLAAPKERVALVYNKVRDLYRGAYGEADLPDVFGTREYASSRRMREYVRSWINAWDLHRLYGYESNPADTIFEEVKQNLDEDEDMQNEPDDDGPMTVF